MFPENTTKGTSRDRLRERERVSEWVDILPLTCHFPVRDAPTLCVLLREEGLKLLLKSSLKKSPLQQVPPLPFPRTLSLNGYPKLVKVFPLFANHCQHSVSSPLRHHQSHGNKERNLGAMKKKALFPHQNVGS